MKSIEEIYKSICYIEAHLKEPITILDAAISAGYSMFHFSRLFNSVTGHSPYDYIMRRRLSEAAKDIMHSDERVTDIAFEYQFNSLETFSRAFKKMFGVPPNKFKLSENQKHMGFKVPITLEYLFHINRISLFKPVIIDMKSMNLVGVIISGGSCNDFLKARSLLKEQICTSNPCAINGSEAEMLTLSFHPMSWSGEDFTHLLCVEAASLEDIPCKCLGKTVPCGNFIEFLHQGSRADLVHTYHYIFQTWLPLSGYSAGAPYTIEKYPEGQQDYTDALNLRLLVPVRKQSF